MPEDSSTPAPLEGGCLCGRTRYALHTAQREGYFCHCRMCQLAFGNLFAPWVNVAAGELRWTGELPQWYRSSKIAERAFCPRCGTPLAFRFLDGDRVDLSIGSLDHPEQIAPVEHFAVESRVQRWFEPQGLTQTRLDTFAPIAERWQKNYGDAPPGVDTARRS